jgi:hypothetical protein
MDTMTEALSLLRRREELESAMRKPGGIRVLEERELLLLRSKIEQLPESTKAVLQVTRVSRRLESPRPQDEPSLRVNPGSTDSWQMNSA